MTKLVLLFLGAFFALACVFWPRRRPAIVVEDLDSAFQRNAHDSSKGFER